MKSLATLTAVALVATCATAYSAELNYDPYVGLDFGYMKTHSQRARLNIDDEFVMRIDNKFTDHQLTGTLVAGARFAKYFGVEAFMQRGREEKESVDLSQYIPGGALPVNYKVQTTSQLKFAWGLDVNGYLPVTERFTLVGGLGLGFYNFTHSVKASVMGTNLPIRISQEEDNVLGIRLSAGVDYKINENWSARTAFRYVKLDPGALEWTDNIKEVTFGLRYAF